MPRLTLSFEFPTRFEYRLLVPCESLVLPEAKQLFFWVGVDLELLFNVWNGFEKKTGLIVELSFYDWFYFFSFYFGPIDGPSSVGAT